MNFFCQNKKLKNEININKNIEEKHFSIIINIFEINKRLLFFNKTICLSLINRKKKNTGQAFIKRRKYKTWDGSQRPDSINHKSKTQQFSTKMVIKENISKQSLPHTIQRSFANT